MVFLFEACILDTDRRELRRSGRLEPVEPQVFDLLAYLVSNRGRVVGRDELFRAVWDGRFVTDAALSTRLHAVRRAIGDDGAAQRLVRTIHGRGLRFVGEVREERTPGPPLDVQRAGAPTLAVLPPQALDGETQQSGFAARAFGDELAAQLSQLRWITLAADASAEARYAVEARVSHLPGRMRAIVRLLEPRTGNVRWAGRYAERSTDVFELHERVAARAAAELAAQVYVLEVTRASVAPDGELEIWDAVVRALSLMNLRSRRHVAAARSIMATTVRSHPSSSAAKSLLSFLTTLGVHMGWERCEPTIPRAVEMSDHASLLNPEDAWAHLAAGYATIYRHAEDAIPYLQRAVALEPRLSIAHYFLALAFACSGHCDDAFSHADEAERLAPFDLLARGNSGVYDNVRCTTAFAAGEFEKGIEFARRSLAQNRNLVPAHRGLVMNLASSGRVAEARAALEELRRLAPAFSLGWLEENNVRVWTRRLERERYVEAFRVAGLR